MKNKISLLFILLTVQLFSTESFTKNMDKHNPLHPGTDPVFAELFNTGLELKDSGRDDEFMVRMTEAGERAGAITDDISEIISLYYIGVKYLELNRIREAENTLNRIYRISTKTKTIDEKYYWLYAFQAECYVILGDYKNALISSEKAVKGIEKIYGKENRFTIELYQNLGNIYYNNGNTEMFKYYTEMSLEYAEKVLGEKHIILSIGYNSLAGVYNNSGDYDNAIVFLNKSLKICIESLGEKHKDTAGVYNNIGVAYLYKGDYEHAISYFQKALSVIIQVLGETHPTTAIYYNNLGGAYDGKNDYDTALAYYEKALGINLKIHGEMHPATGQCYNNIGSIYLATGDYDRALVNLQKSLNINITMLGEDHPSVATDYNNIALTHAALGDYVKAIFYTSKALALFKQLELNQDIIDTTWNLGWIYCDSGNFHDAYASFLAGIETIEKVRRLNLSAGTDFTSRNICSFYYAGTACFLDRDMENMFNISERMRAMGYLERLSLKAAIDAAGIDPEQGKKLLKLKDDIERLSALRQQLLSMKTDNMNKQQKKSHDAQFEDTSKQLARAEAEFIKLDSEFMKNEKYRLLRNASVVTVKEAQKLCAKDGAIIEYILPEKTDDYMKPYAIIITGSSINAVELDPAFDYSGSVDRYRKAIIKENKEPEINSTGAELYSKLIAPIEGFINPNNIRKLIIVPDGSLAFLPFDSIKTKEGKYLSERYELNLTPSVTVSCMIKDRKYDKRDNLMAFGGATYSSTGESRKRGESSFRGIIIEEQNKEKLAVKAYNSPLEYYKAQQLGWADLPGTEREVSAINEKIYKKKNTDVYKGEKVSEENLKSLSKSGRLKKYSSIHLACHGYYDPEYPAYSAVVFSEVSGKLKDSRDDGYMSVEETALLNLQSEIVVLSACETGLGRMVSGDGVIGLTRAFQVAGSNRVLVTLWPVSDEATEEFMVSFYAKVRAGMDYSEALVKVKEEFRRSDKYSAPYYWAGFVLYE